MVDRVDCCPPPPPGQAGWSARRKILIGHQQDILRPVVISSI